MKKTVLWWGRFGAGYSRNRVYRALFKELGWEVVDFNTHCCMLGDWEARLRGVKTPDLVWLPCFRQRDTMAAVRWAKSRGVPVIFDPLISAWDKKVLEQQKWSAEEFRAKRLLKHETRLFNSVDMLLADTSCHADFFHNRMHVPRERLRVLFTGTDETVFKVGDDFENPRPRDPDAPLRVLYHGAYIPLHGTEVIVEAARMTQHLPIHWDFLGWGKYKASTEEKAKGITNITFLEKVPYTEVPSMIQSADVVLGVFGTTDKAARVIGNKVYEAMACGRPVINEYCTGYPDAAKETPAIRFIPAGDPAALVEAVQTFWDAREKLPELNREARRFFEENLSMAVIKEQLRAILEDIEKIPKRN